MKRLFTITFILFSLFVSANAQAMSVWNWEIFATTGGPITGTLMTSTDGYAAGTYTLTSFTVLDAGMTGMPTGDYDFNLLSGAATAYRLEWDGTMLTGTFTVDGMDNGVNSFWEFQNGDSTIDIDRDNAFWRPGDELFTGGDFQITPVPIPAATWLFMSGLIGLISKGHKARQSVA